MINSICCSMCFKRKEKEIEKREKKHNGVDTCLNTLFWMRPSIGFLQLHRYYSYEVANLHAYTSSSSQSMLASKKNESEDITL